MGRNRGDHNLSDQAKAEILAEKYLQISTQEHIATRHGVSRDTVTRLTPETVTPEILLLADRKVRDFATINEENRYLVSEIINEKLKARDIKDGVLPNLLSVLQNTHRLETAQPTSISSEAALRDGIRNLLVNLFQHFQADLPRENPLPRVEAESLARVVLGD
jgi:hypothetical protein